MSETQKIIDAEVNNEPKETTEKQQEPIEVIKASKPRRFFGWCKRHAKSAVLFAGGFAAGVIAKTALTKNGNDVLPEEEIIQDVEPSELTPIE